MEVNVPADIAGLDRRPEHYSADFIRGLCGQAEIFF
jgi:hypothetical protein